MTAERLKHRIERAKARLAEYDNIPAENLSAAGHWSEGYWKGTINILEEWLDDIVDGGNSNGTV